MADDRETRSAIEEGRRIYIGSLRYTAKPEDIEVLLQSHGFTHEKIHMSIDPISARNPGYCFVELPVAEEASRALTVLDGQSVLGRAVKTGPCEAKGSTPRYKSYERNKHQEKEPTFQRWGDWRGSSAGQTSDGGAYVGGKGHRSEQHLDEYAANKDGRRLFVSGLPKMLNQQTNDAEMRDFFSGFDV
jgi:RNA recognition motif-containing protein